MTKRSKARRKKRVQEHYFQLRKENAGVGVMSAELCHILAKDRAKRDPLWSWLTDWGKPFWRGR